ncbi:MAG: DUF3047 domain-containing protein [Candidatus Omnitrophota bacterium]|nr:DUF3047 domain-containing protein [Candidatus Omnitrophota bacterium]
MNKLRIKILIGVLILLIIVFSADRMFNFYKMALRLFPHEEAVTTVKSFSFSGKDSLKEWSEKILNGQVSYTVESQEGESYVHAVSDNACSAMYYQIRLDASRHPFLSWRWRVAAFPNKTSPEDLSRKGQDDYAARVYVIFPAIFFPKSKAIEYVWANDAKPGTIVSSPYSPNIKVMVAESGTREGWAEEERDIYKDYVAAFGSRPMLAIGAISFMCDSDSTKSKAETFFDDIKIFYKK